MVSLKRIRGHVRLRLWHLFPRCQLNFCEFLLTSEPVCHRIDLWQVTVFKCFAVILSVGGCAVLSLENSQGGTDKAIGYVWEVGSVILYAVYEVFYKRFCCHPSDPFPTANSQRFFGLCGLLTLILVWPFFFILDHIKYEPFQWPTQQEAMYVVLINSIFVFVFFLFCRMFIFIHLFFHILTRCHVDAFLLHTCLNHG